MSALEVNLRFKGNQRCIYSSGITLPLSTLLLGKGLSSVSFEPHWLFSSWGGVAFEIPDTDRPSLMLHHRCWSLFHLSWVDARGKWIFLLAAFSFLNAKLKACEQRTGVNFQRRVQRGAGPHLDAGTEPGPWTRVPAPTLSSAGAESGGARAAN